MAGINTQWGKVVNYNYWTLGTILGYFLSEHKKIFSFYLIGRISYIDFKGKIEGNGAWASLSLGGEYKKVLFIEIGPEALLLRDKDTGISVTEIEPTIVQVGARFYLFKGRR